MRARTVSPDSNHQAQRIERLLAVAKRYQDTQPDGVKQIQAQLALFTRDTVFVSFPVAQVVGSHEPRLLVGREALRQAFLDYNAFIGGVQSLTMTYHDVYAHQPAETEIGTCGFTLLINMQRDNQVSSALNHLQLHVNEQGLICRSMNWQASMTGQSSHAIMARAFGLT